eukprot:TRINITY_DN1437_c1_g3_i1.p1 TRINITY_DN1437_c1_g3~~TRINITY_DN1437_c1_g3_i1.p1  ORF type:complete len:477 (+),score=101.90 TRINITY_DN1437_c1_g3_i1:134-1564(+)
MSFLRRCFHRLSISQRQQSPHHDPLRRHHTFRTVELKPTSMASTRTPTRTTKPLHHWCLSPIRITAVPSVSSISCIVVTRAYHEPASLPRNTIFSVASGHNGRTGVSVIRISGEQSSRALELLSQAPQAASRTTTSTTTSSTTTATTATTGTTATTAKAVHTTPSLPKSRRMVYRQIWDPSTGDPLDHCMAVRFKGPRSFTGEDVTELHLHGSGAVVSGVMEALSRIEGLRVAEAGEFTKRAFHNGKLDLSEVEGLADLLNAETSEQRKHALFHMKGSLSSLYLGWADSLTRVLAHVEADIDFGDEEDLGEAVLRPTVAKVEGMKEEMARHLSRSKFGERLRTGARVALVGVPNAGKSSLLNLLAKRKAAIVSPTPGTTRDVVEVALDVCGYPVIVSDTAGIRDFTNDEIEREGGELARGRIRDSDIVLLVVDSSSPPTTNVLDTLVLPSTISSTTPTTISSSSSSSSSSPPPPTP